MNREAPIFHKRNETIHKWEILYGNVCLPEAIMILGPPTCPPWETTNFNITRKQTSNRSLTVTMAVCCLSATIVWDWDRESRAKRRSQVENMNDSHQKGTLNVLLVSLLVVVIPPWGSHELWACCQKASELVSHHPIVHQNLLSSMEIPYESTKHRVWIVEYIPRHVIYNFANNMDNTNYIYIYIICI